MGQSTPNRLKALRTRARSSRRPARKRSDGGCPRARIEVARKDQKQDVLPLELQPPESIAGQRHDNQLAKDSAGLAGVGLAALPASETDPRRPTDRRFGVYAANASSPEQFTYLGETGLAGRDSSLAFQNWIFYILSTADQQEQFAMNS